MTGLLWVLLLTGCRDGRSWDADGDGFDNVEHGGRDCDDTAPTVAPGAPELCNGVDDDCDGMVDEVGDVDRSSGVLLALDEDGDGHGDPLRLVVQCAPTPGLVSAADDCNDADPSIYPGANDTCDRVDTDCNGIPDDGPDVPTWFVDADGDGHGTSIATVRACVQPAGHAPLDDDCNDADPAAYPGAQERCNARDDDCNGLTDDDDPVQKPDERPWFPDNDGDGFGVPEGAVVRCDPPEGFVAAIGDCADNDSSRYPGATEICDQLDQDCDGATDEEPADGQTVYADFDGDGFGVREATVLSCKPLQGFSDTPGDCADALAGVNPGATEACNQIDDDCDGAIDDDDDSVAIGLIPHFRDADGDGFGDQSDVLERCTPTPTWVARGTDCDDTADAVHPDAPEVCDNGIDDNCDASPAPCGLRGLTPGRHTVDALAEATISTIRSDGNWVSWDYLTTLDLDGDGTQEHVTGYDGWISPLIHPGDSARGDDLVDRVVDRSSLRAVSDPDRDGQLDLILGGKLDGGPYIDVMVLPLQGFQTASVDTATLTVRRDERCRGVGTWYADRDLPGVEGYSEVRDNFSFSLIALGSALPQGNVTSCDIQQGVFATAPFVRRSFLADLSGDGLDEVYLDTQLSIAARASYTRFDAPSGELSPQSADGVLAFESGISVHTISRVLDLDGDSRDDLIGEADFGSLRQVFVLNGRVFDASDSPITLDAFVRLPPTNTFHGVGDFDGDGELDLATWNNSASALEVFHGPFTPGEQRQTESQLQLLSLGYFSIHDLNADGRDDVLIDQSAIGTFDVIFGSGE